MIYRFNIVSDEVNNFKRVIEIDSDATFFDLRNAILDSVDYTKDQMDSFFICDDDWSKRIEITLTDMGTDSDVDVYLMEDTKLSDLIEEDDQKLLYVFDYLPARAFFMEMKESIPGQYLSAPVCTKKVGKAGPQNIDIDEFTESSADVQSQGILDDEFDDNLYDEDELESEGLTDCDLDDLN